MQNTRAKRFTQTALLAALLLGSTAPGFAQEAKKLYLSGTDKDHTVDWEFRLSEGRGSGAWTTIPVPSNWELEGFGTYNYGRDQVRNDRTRSDAQGFYRHRFEVPPAWHGRDVRLVFEGVMTDAEVQVNGEPAGPRHQGAFYRFGYDVTDLVRYGGKENLLEVTVSKQSANESVTKAERWADYWIFGGIFRPVYLEAYPPQHIERMALDARANGSFQANVHLDDPSGAGRVTAQIQTMDGEPIGEAFSEAISSGNTVVTLRTQIDNPETWTPESPTRYQVAVQLKNNSTLHETTEPFGFRTVEVRPQDGLYVNGQKVRLKGVNRHSFWPESGRTTSRAISEMDAQLMKDMNMNAVRMSHYPPDEHFLEVCDSLGLFVIDELTGWQSAYDTEVGEKLVRELVTRDVNHPSVILWANGNEGGWNDALDDDFARYDPQQRAVIHPFATHGGINTAHYRNWDCCAGTFFHGRDVFMPTEFLHGLYDGGHGAGLADWWDSMLKSPRSAGGFLWALLDEAVLRTDLGDTLDTDLNRAPDGIVGPYRKAKEGSFYAIKEIWSPVYVRESELDRLPASFDGTLRLENRYHYTNLGDVDFAWKLVDFPGPASADTGHTVAARGQPAAPDAPPRAEAVLALNLPGDWRAHDALFLTATDPHGREVFTWTWMIQRPEATRQQVVSAGSGQVTGSASNGRVTLRAGETEVAISAETGRLLRVEANGDVVSLSDGPNLLHSADSLTNLEHHADSAGYVVEATYDGHLKRVRWHLMPSGWLQLDYRYRMGGAYDHVGVTFNYPEEHITGMRWLGRGPYRVWKNRRAGMRYGVWQKDYNTTRTGIEWDYPEFKGHHANLHWAQIQTREGPITVATDTDDLFLRMLTPDVGPDPRHTAVDFPEGDLSFLHGIAPIGTKFRRAAMTGPSGRPNYVSGKDQYEGTLYFYFGADLPALSAAN